MLKLQVVISNHCWGCQKALTLAKLAAERFSELRVAVVNLDEEPLAKPPQAIAVPAYILDGTLLFLGNPSAEELFDRISVRVRDIK